MPNKPAGVHSLTVTNRYQRVCWRLVQDTVCVRRRQQEDDQRMPALFRPPMLAPQPPPGMSQITVQVPEGGAVSRAHGILAALLTPLAH